MEPDALHLHSLFYYQVALPAAINHSTSGDHHRANSRVAPRLWLHGALCLVLALVFHEQTIALMLSLGAYALLYHWQYQILAKLRRMRSIHVPVLRQHDAPGD